MNAPRFTAAEKSALLAFYRATGNPTRADYLERGWLQWASIDRENLAGIREASGILKVAA